MSNSNYPERPDLWEDTTDKRTASQKLWQKCRDEPFVPIGMVPTVNICSIH